MKYSDNTIVQKFIEQLVDALKYKNECKESYDEKFNIPFFSICTMAGFNGSL